jgi:hypothetical protein
VGTRPVLLSAVTVALAALAVCSDWAGVAPASTRTSLPAIAASPRATRVNKVPGQLTTLLSIACVSRTRCYGAGSHAIVQVVAGRPTKPVKVVGASLESISCAGPVACEAVGETGRSQLAAVVAVADGRPGPAREVGNGVYVLQDVSCASSDVCEAVGGDQGVLVKTVNASPSGSQGVEGIGDFASISCASSTVCEAVGNGVDTLGGGYVSIVDGVPAAARREPDQMALQAIACPAAGSCEAVGGFAYPHRHEGVIAAIRDGRFVDPHVLANLATFGAIACPTATTCYALAYTQSRRSGAQRTVLVSIVNGHAHSERDLPDTLNSIACPSTTLCYAAGNQPARPYDGVVVTVPVAS